MCMRACSVMPNSLWPMDCNLPSSSVHGIFQVRILKQFATSENSGDLSEPGIKSASLVFPLLEADIWQLHQNLEIGQKKSYLYLFFNVDLFSRWFFLSHIENVNFFLNCLKYFIPHGNNQRQRNQRSNCQHCIIDKTKEFQKKHLLLLYCLRQSLWLCRSQQTMENSSRYGNTRIPHLPPEKEKAMVPHSSTLAWKIPWMEEPGRLQSMRSLRVGHNWATSFSLSCIGEGNGNPLQWVLAWRIPGMEEPGGLSSLGSHRVRHDWSDLAAAAYWEICMWIKKQQLEPNMEQQTCSK